jgi:uroporphyrinogen-III decarboxylase
MCHRHGVPYLRHEDGSITAVEKQFLLGSGIDGWHAIEPEAGMDICYFKDKYGDRITLAGNIDCALTLVYGSPDDIRKEVREKIRHCAPGGGYIASSSNSIHNGVPARNLLIMREAIEEYGHYPIKG